MFKQCKMVGTLFNNCKMHGTQFIDSDMTEAVLEGSDAFRAVFIRCNFTNINLNNVNVLGAIFEDCKDNGVPITKEWLSAHGAVNFDRAIVRHSLINEQLMLNSSP